MEPNYCPCFDTLDRTSALGQHKAFVQGVERYVIPAFQNIEQDAESFFDQEYKRLFLAPAEENGPDGSDLAELARERGFDLFQDLVFANGQVMIMATAGLYHLWEKTLKSFLERESHFFPERYFGENPKKTIQGAIFPKIQEWLSKWGFCKQPCALEIMDRLHTLNLVANTAKHGAGSSCNALYKKEPEFFKGPYPEASPVLPDEIKNHPEFNRADPDDLWVTTEMFHDFADIVEQFWNAMPERLNITYGRSEKILIRQYALQRMFEQQMFGQPQSNMMECIRTVLLHGHVVENYPDDTPYPTSLRLGHDKHCKPLHVVVAENSNKKHTVIVDVYHPNPDLWMSDWTTRRNRL